MERARIAICAFEAEYRNALSSTAPTQKLTEEGTDACGDTPSYVILIWREFLALVMGHRGPYQKEGPGSKSKQMAESSIKSPPS